MSTSHVLSAIEPLIPNATNGLLTPSSNQQSRSPDIDRNLSVSLDDRGRYNFIWNLFSFIALLPTVDSDTLQIPSINIIVMWHSVFKKR